MNAFTPSKGYWQWKAFSNHKRQLELHTLSFYQFLRDFCSILVKLIDSKKWNLAKNVEGFQLKMTGSVFMKGDKLYLTSLTIFPTNCCLPLAKINLNPHLAGPELRPAQTKLVFPLSSFSLQTQRSLHYVNLIFDCNYIVITHSSQFKNVSLHFVWRKNMKWQVIKYWNKFCTTKNIYDAYSSFELIPVSTD